MDKKMQGVKVAVLLCDGFEEVEMVKPRAALKKAGAEVFLITPNANQVKAWNHDHWTKKYSVDVKLEKANPADYDMVLLPGGVINPDKLRTSKEAIRFIAHFFKNKKIIAAICHGPWTLIETGQIKGKKMTSYHSIKSDMINAGAKWQNKKVVIDDLLITSRQPSDIPAFNKAMIDTFTKKNKNAVKKTSKAKNGKTKRTH